MPASAIGAVGAIGSAVLGAKSAKKSQKAQERALEAASTQITPFTFFGPGGISGGFGAGPGGGTVRPGGPGGTVGGVTQLGGGTDQARLPTPIGRTVTGLDIFDLGLTDQQGRKVVLTSDGKLRISGSGKPFNGLIRKDGQFFRPREIVDQFFGARGESAVSQQFAPQGVFGDLGSLNPAFEGLVGLAGQGINAASAGAGMPPALQAALARASVPITVGQDGTLGAINQGIGSQFAANLQGVQGLQEGGFQRGLQETAFGAALEQAARAGRGFGEVADSTLGLLREQARPFEERAFQDLQENLFSTGRLGTSGGSLQTEAFARGLAQADIGRQLQAQQEARNVQAQALQQAQGLSGLGSGIRGIEDQLLQSAFGRFAETARIGADVTGQRFQQDATNAGFLIDQNQSNFGNVLQALPVGRALRQSDLSFALSALQGQGALFNQSLAPFDAALRAAQVKANAEIGAGSNIANIIGNNNFNPGGGTEILANVFGNVATHRQDIADVLGGLFGRGGA